MKFIHQPRRIIASSKVPSDIVEILREPDEMELLEGVDVLKMCEFVLGGALQRILNLPLAEFTGMDEMRDRENVLESIIDVHAGVAVRLVMTTLVDAPHTDQISAAGGLLAGLERLRKEDYVHELCAAPLCNDDVWIDPEAFASLEILSSTTQQRTLSLHSVIDVTRSRGGRQLLRHWITHPTRDLETLAWRHDAVAYLSRPENRELARRTTLAKSATLLM